VAPAEKVAQQLLRLLGIPERAAVVRVALADGQLGLVLELDRDYLAASERVPAMMDGYHVKVRERTAFVSAS
jgi:hypothetical protein